MHQVWREAKDTKARDVLEYHVLVRVCCMPGMVVPHSALPQCFAISAISPRDRGCVGLAADAWG
eukprot:12395743-Alexandrium_andersonii.AAC.1